MFSGAAKRAEEFASANGHKIAGPVIDPDGAIADTDPASIFFTSGSTEKPKGGTQSHATLMAGAGWWRPISG